MANRFGECSSLCDCVCAVSPDGNCLALAELSAENERLRETNEAIKRVTKEWRVDAGRYRWLKTFALYRNEHDASIEFYWSRRAYDLDVDAAIDAARADAAE